MQVITDMKQQQQKYICCFHRSFYRYPVKSNTNLAETRYRYYRYERIFVLEWEQDRIELIAELVLKSRDIYGIFRTNLLFISVKNWMIVPNLLTP